MQFSIKGDTGSVTINVHQNDSTVPRDPIYNWYPVEISVAIPGYTAAFTGLITLHEIESLAKQVKQVYEGQLKKIEVPTLEAGLEITATTDKLGHVIWHLITTYPMWTGARLDFSFTADQSYLPVLVKELETVASEIKNKK